MASNPPHTEVGGSSIYASRPSHIVVKDRSLVFVVISSTATIKASSIDIETTCTIPRDTRSRKTSHLQEHIEKRDWKSIEDNASIIATRRWSEDKKKDKYRRKISRTIFDEINILHGTNLNKRTVRLYTTAEMLMSQ